MSCCVTGGFTFPNCLGPLTVTVGGSGSPPPTGNVTLQISGGKLGANAVTIGTVSPAPAACLCCYQTRIIWTTVPGLSHVTGRALLIRGFACKSVCSLAVDTECA